MEGLLTLDDIALVEWSDYKSSPTQKSTAIARVAHLKHDIMKKKNNSWPEVREANED